tara:strand:- start:245 stop:607 length:363 start_codon:yes stop_codon:yes gene_type:complete
MKYYIYPVLISLLLLTSAITHADLDKDHILKLSDCYSYYTRQYVVYKFINQEKHMSYKNKALNLENFIMKKYPSLDEVYLNKYYQQWSKSYRHLIQERGELNHHLTLETNYEEFCKELKK